MKKPVLLICAILLLGGILSGCSRGVKPTTLNPANVFDDSETITADGYSYSSPSFSFSKVLPEGVKKNEVIYFDEKTDEAGKLLGDFTYAFANITIKNNISSDKINIGSCEFVASKDNEELVRLSGEPRYQSTGSENENHKDYFWVKIEPNKSRTITLGYILEDKNLATKPLYFRVTSIDNGEGYENYQAFKVDVP